MDIDEVRDKIIGKIRLNLPGYEQLLPRGQLALQWEIKKILKEFIKSVTEEKSNVT